MQNARIVEIGFQARALHRPADGQMFPPADKHPWVTEQHRKK